MKKTQKREIIARCKTKWRKRTLISTATEGWIRYEWAAARYGQIIPMNWEASGFDLNYSSIGYSIDDAYNLITKKALDLGVDWLITVEDDVLLPPDCFSKFQKYTKQGDYPVVSGLYYLKGEPTEPLVFRGRGTGSYEKWKVGSKVWCDGVPMGCLLIHTSLLKWMWDHTEDYVTADGIKLRKVFETPQYAELDPEVGGYLKQAGTQDLYFWDRIMEHDVLKKTGWGNVCRKKYPLLVDTSIFCRHIDRQTGRMYP